MQFYLQISEPSCRDGVREHARNHEQQEQVTESYYTTVSLQSGGCDETCIYQDKEKHYHCNWVNTPLIILNISSNNYIYRM